MSAGPEAVLAALDRRPEPGPVPSFEIEAPAITALSNGTPLWVIPRPGLPLQVVRLAVRGGSCADPQELAGLVGMADALLHHGAGSRDAVAFAQALERLAVALGVHTDLESTGITLDAALPRLEAGLDLMADAVLRPWLAADALERVRKLRLGDLAMELADPEALAGRVARRSLYGAGHPADHRALGDEAGLKSTGREAIQASHAARFSPDRAIFVASGPLSPEEVRERLEARFGGWAVSAPLEERSAPPPAAGGLRGVCVDAPGAAQASICVLAPAPGPHDPRLYGARLASIVLGGSFTSRLNRILREERGYTYGVGARLQVERTWSTLIVRTAVQTEVAGEALGCLLGELYRLREGISAAELARARNVRRTQFIQGLETRRGAAEGFSALWESGRDPAAFADELAAIQDIGLDEVAAAVGGFLLEAGVVTVVGDLGRIRSGLEAAVAGWSEVERG